MLSFLACVAREMLVVCIPRAAEWGTAAGDGRGDAFFVDVMLTQNAGEYRSMQAGRRALGLSNVSFSLSLTLFH